MREKEKKYCAPVILFVYKRPEHTKQCVQALKHNIMAEHTDLYIFSDGPKTEKDAEAVNFVRNYIHTLETEGIFQKVSVVESEKNKGLAASIIAGVTQIINEYGRAIIVEDDLITSKDFLQFMNGALDYYADIPKVGSVSGHTYPVSYLDSYQKDIYLIRKGECWGWATWKDRWEKVDWSVASYPEYLKNRKMQKEFKRLEYGLDRMLKWQMKGKLDSWAVRWCYHLFREGLLTVYPSASRTKNIGIDGSGTHCQADNRKTVCLYEGIEKCHYEMMGVIPQLEKQVAVFEKETLAEKIKRYRRILQR